MHFDTGKKVKKILTGIDIERAKLCLLTDWATLILFSVIIRWEKDLSSLDEVMHMQADILSQYGVPINIAESVMKPRISEISRAVNPANVNQSIDAAKLVRNQHNECSHAGGQYGSRIFSRKKSTRKNSIMSGKSSNF